MMHLPLLPPLPACHGPPVAASANFYDDLLNFPSSTISKTDQLKNRPRLAESTHSWDQHLDFQRLPLPPTTTSHHYHPQTRAVDRCISVAQYEGYVQGASDAQRQTIAPRRIPPPSFSSPSSTCAPPRWRPDPDPVKLTSSLSRTGPQTAEIHHRLRTIRPGMRNPPSRPPSQSGHPRRHFRRARHYQRSCWYDANVLSRSLLSRRRSRQRRDGMPSC